MIAKAAGTEILMQLSEQSLQLVTFFKEARRDLFNNYFSLSQGSIKIKKNICVCTESTDLI
jgi:hypothetical protein